MTLQRNLTLLLVKANGLAAGQADNTSALGDAAKAMSRKLRPTDSIYHLAPELFGLVLQETDTLNGKRIAVRLQKSCKPCAPNTAARSTPPCTIIRSMCKAHTSGRHREIDAAGGERGVRRGARAGAAKA